MLRLVRFVRGKSACIFQVQIFSIYYEFAKSALCENFFEKIFNFKFNKYASFRKK